MAVIALDLGGTKIASAIIDRDGNVKYLHKNLLAGRGGAEVGRLIIESIDRQLQKADYCKIKIDAIGVCVPGSVDPDTGMVWALVKISSESGAIRWLKSRKNQRLLLGLLAQKS